MYDEYNEPTEQLINDWNINNDHDEEYDKDHLTECPKYEDSFSDLECICLNYSPEWTL